MRHNAILEGESVMDKSYSVLMSVYQKEHSEYLYAAIKSMAGQSMKPLEIVLVCDGPLTKELDAVLEKTEFQDVLKVSGLQRMLAWVRPCLMDCRSVPVNG